MLIFENMTLIVLCFICIGNIIFTVDFVDIFSPDFCASSNRFISYTSLRHVIVYSNTNANDYVASKSRLVNMYETLLFYHYFLLNGLLKLQCDDTFLHVIKVTMPSKTILFCHVLHVFAII